MIVLLREHVHTECHRKLNFGMDTGSELYMQILQGGGGVLSPNSNIFRNKISGHVTCLLNEIPRKTIQIC